MASNIAANIKRIVFMVYLLTLGICIPDSDR